MKTVKIVCKENKRLGYKIINEEDMLENDIIFDEDEDLDIDDLLDDEEKVEKKKKKNK